jgi:uncharacterized protein (TIGR03083 family)
MPASVSPSIDNLELTWRSLVDLCAGLSDEEWQLPTGCPGWSVQDQISHLIDYESRALGRPAPDGEAKPFPHTKNALGESNEIGVEHRRGRSGREVLDELREVTAARSAQLRALTADDLAGEALTPVGPATVADMLRLRVMDTWSHEQDIRRAVGRPGHDRGPAVEATVAYFSQFLPLIVGKRAAAPDGAVVVIEIGDVDRAVIEVVDGRARPVEADADADATGRTPTTHLSMPATTFGALVGGRSDVPEDVVIDGDADLGHRIIGALGFMP